MNKNLTKDFLNVLKYIEKEFNNSFKGEKKLKEKENTGINNCAKTRYITVPYYRYLSPKFTTLTDISKTKADTFNKSLLYRSITD